MANTFQEKELKTRWPVTTGTDADSKHEGRQTALVPEKGTFFPKRLRRGID